MISSRWIRKKAKDGDYTISSHAEEERMDEMISAFDIKHALCYGEILEQYASRKDIRGDSCLVFGPDEDGSQLHVVLAKTPTKAMRVVTVYLPKLPQWLDPQTRR